MLPFWTSYLIRTYAWMIMLRDNGVVNSILQALGITSEPIILLNTDLSVILGMTYGFLPFAILPLFVSIDRLDASLVVGGARPVRERPVGVPARDAAADDARASWPPSILTFIPAIGDFVTPGPPRRGRDDDHRQGDPGAVPRRAATGRTARRSASS